MAQSLFGLTADELIASRDLSRQQAINKQAEALGVFAPLYAASRGLSQMGINALAQGLFPQAQDPELRKATEIQSLMQEFDPTNPAQSYTNLATALAQRGYGREAALAAAEANKLLTQSKEFGLKEQEVGARIKALEEQQATREEAKTKRVDRGVTTQGLATYSLGNGEEVYITNEEGKREKYDPRKHGRYETAANRMAAPRPVYERDAFQNVYQMNPDGTKTLVIPGLLQPGQTPQAASGAAPATGRLKYEPGKGLVGGNK
jgi:hypothetical protein